MSAGRRCCREREQSGTEGFEQAVPRGGDPDRARFVVEVDHALDRRGPETEGVGALGPSRLSMAQAIAAESNRPSIARELGGGPSRAGLKFPSRGRLEAAH